MEENLKNLCALYDEQVRFETELAERTKIIMGEIVLAQIADLKEEMGDILREIRLKIRTLEAQIKNQAMDEERSLSKHGLFVEYLPWTKVITSYPGTDLLDMETSKPPRVKIRRVDDKPKKHRPAQMIMKLF